MGCFKVFRAFCYTNEGNFEVYLALGKDMKDTKQLKDYFMPGLKLIRDILLLPMRLKQETLAKGLRIFIHFLLVITLNFAY